MSIPAQVPPCYGHLYSPTNEQCMACLINHHCKTATSKPKADRKTEVNVDNLPKDKKSLILLVCHLYGIPPVMLDKKEQREYAITEENKDQYFNLDCLLTSKAALKILIAAKAGG